MHPISSSKPSSKRGGKNSSSCSTRESNFNQFNSISSNEYAYSPTQRGAPTQVDRSNHLCISQDHYQSSVQASVTQENFSPQDLLGSPFADVALQYGMKLMGTGKGMMDKEINRFISIAKLRHFFSVDTHYVIKKLLMLMFPFSKHEWSLKYYKRNRLEPRYDHNAPDLYIPLMGYLTYILVADLNLGIKNVFSPEHLGTFAGQGLAWTLVEIFVELFTIYFTNIPTTLTFLDLLAYSGYKFVGVVICTIFKLLFGIVGYIIALLYCGGTTAFFTVNFLKWRLMTEIEDSWNGSPQHVNGAYNRKMYFLLLICLSQAVQIWWFSSYLHV